MILIVNGCRTGLAYFQELFPTSMFIVNKACYPVHLWNSIELIMANEVRDPFIFPVILAEL